MLQSAITVFFLMLGAALLGFLIGWAWLRERLVQYRNELNQKISISKKIETEQHNLIAHANALQAQQKKLIYNNQQDQFKLNEMSTTIAHLKHEKELLAEDFNHYKRAAKNNENADSDYSNEIENLKNHLLQKEEDISNWKNKYQLLLEIKKESDLMLQKLSKKRNDLEDTIKSNGNGSKKKSSTQEKKKKWETKYKALNLKLLQVTKERDELLKKKTSVTESGKGKKKFESKESESALDKLKDEVRQWNNQTDTHPTFQGSEMEIKILNEIFQNKHRINFDRIGLARGNEKDDLKLIKGIGPFIEKKLNALGIYQFIQIAKFKDDDIEKINKIMKLDPEDYITKNWIEDARSRIEEPK